MNRNNGRQIAERLFLLRDFIVSNADRKNAVSLAQIQKYYYDNSILSKDGTFLNKKTIYNDIAALGTVAGLDIQYSEKHKGYLLLNAPFEANDLRLIVDSVQASKFITQSEAKKLTEKITLNFGSGRRQNLNRQAYVYDRIRSQNDSVVQDSDKLHEAISSDRKVSFRYFHLTPDKSRSYSNEGKQIIVSPYALYWNNGNLYLYAFNGMKMAFYRVDRMERITGPLSDKREGKDQFSSKSLTTQKAKVFQMYSGQAHDVKMRFRNNLADSVFDEFGRDLMMVPEDREHFTFTAKVELSPPFYAWVATFGRRAKIIGPAAAIEGMKEFLQKASDMYKDEGNI